MHLVFYTQYFSSELGFHFDVFWLSCFYIYIYSSIHHSQESSKTLKKIILSLTISYLVPDAGGFVLALHLQLLQVLPPPLILGGPLPFFRQPLLFVPLTLLPFLHPPLTLICWLVSHLSRFNALGRGLWIKLSQTIMDLKRNTLQLSVSILKTTFQIECRQCWYRGEVPMDVTLIP